MDWMLLPLRKYAQFSGRSRRKEFWMFALFTLIVYIIAIFLDSALGLGGRTTSEADWTGTGGAASFQSSGGILTLVVALGLLVPSIALAVRRLHDTDRSGWWLLIGLIPLIGGIVLLVFYCTDGTPGTNRFGPDPKATDPANLADTFS